MRTCSKCNQDKDETAFNFRNKRKGWLNSECKLCVTQRTRAWREANSSRFSAYKKEWREDNKDTIAFAKAEWARLNPDRVNHNNGKYRASKISAAPSWLSADQIKQIKSVYSKARRLTKETGVRHEVDHIVPLRGEKVTGLHVPWNLQVLPMEDNRSKANTYNDWNEYET